MSCPPTAQRAAACVQPTSIVIAWRPLFPMASTDRSPDVSRAGPWGQGSSGIPRNMPDSSSSEDSPQSDIHSLTSSSPTGLSPTGASYAPSHETRPVARLATSARVARPARTPSRYDWSKHKPTIKRLYIDEDKTLREMMIIMEREHNFVAT